MANASVSHPCISLTGAILFVQRWWFGDGYASVLKGWVLAYFCKIMLSLCAELCGPEDSVVLRPLRRFCSAVSLPIRTPGRVMTQSYVHRVFTMLSTIRKSLYLSNPELSLSTAPQILSSPPFLPALIRFTPCSFSNCLLLLM